MPIVYGTGAENRLNDRQWLPATRNANAAVGVNRPASRTGGLLPRLWYSLRKRVCPCEQPDGFWLVHMTLYPYRPIEFTAAESHARGFRFANDARQSLLYLLVLRRRRGIFMPAKNFSSAIRVCEVAAIHQYRLYARAM